MEQHGVLPGRPQSQSSLEYGHAAQIRQIQSLPEPNNLESNGFLIQQYCDICKTTYTTPSHTCSGLSLVNEPDCPTHEGTGNSQVCMNPEGQNQLSTDLPLGWYYGWCNQARRRYFYGYHMGWRAKSQWERPISSGEALFGPSLPDCSQWVPRDPISEPPGYVALPPSEAERSVSPTLQSALSSLELSSTTEAVNPPLKIDRELCFFDSSGIGQSD
ncbi:hypothetical protein P171DRAFT_494344 [Karstenula rhodostoma CBS 690.94]|uniref:WW domain-containing protein n=1 Tax=Karstenula rhodostoma CBS 690.94 TaxID=1392251 RepID=A0A9P4UBH7_9PLEO|nr:hypothetical protein P171DRAFT_494344 [Karstenula rhodostoma CBS 690.94]